MSIYRLLLIAVLAFAAVSHAQADINAAANHLDKPALVGKARMKVMLWKVFDASLYASNGQYDSEKPFALSLSYLRNLTSKKIVEKTISEMKKQKRESASTLLNWRNQLSQIIPDVDKKTNITGVRDEHGHTVFYRNGNLIGRIEDRNFTRGFFDIWLGKSTSKPRFRKKLLGELNS